MNPSSEGGDIGSAGGDIGFGGGDIGSSGGDIPLEVSLMITGGRVKERLSRSNSTTLTMRRSTGVHQC